MEDTGAMDGEGGKSGSRKKLTQKRLNRRVSRIANMDDKRAARKMQNRTARDLLKQIADGDIKNPQAAAKAYFEVFEAAASGTEGEAE